MKKAWLEIRYAWHDGRIMRHSQLQDKIAEQLAGMRPQPYLCIVPGCGHPAEPQGLPAPGAPFCPLHGWEDVHG